MVTNRTWRHPDLRNGAGTLHHITDTHFGAGNHAQFINDWHEKTRHDLDILKVVYNRGHVHTGDMIHWYPGGDNTQADADIETDWYVTWRNSIKATDGMPFAEAVGNHDLLGPGPEGERVPRTSAAWASAVGVASKNVATDMGQFKVITIGPETWESGGGFYLSNSTLTWLDNQLQTAGKPCFIAAHVPSDEQMGTNTAAGNAIEPGNPTFLDICDSNPNAIGYLSGHRHIDINTRPNHASVFSVGSKNMFGINGPPGGGGRNSAVSYADHLTLGTYYSMFITLLDENTLDVRWRDHLGRRWTAPDGETVRRLTR